MARCVRPSRRHPLMRQRPRRARPALALARSWGGLAVYGRFLHCPLFRRRKPPKPLPPLQRCKRCKQQFQPKHRAKDPSTLKYPKRSDYQLEILKSQYKFDAGGPLSAKRGDQAQ